MTLTMINSKIDLAKITDKPNAASTVYTSDPVDIPNAETIPDRLP